MALPSALSKNPARVDAPENPRGRCFRRHERRLGRLPVRKIVLALAGLCCTSWALAQSTSDAATAERMERAKRDASNPLRMIIEASSVKRARPADAPPAAAPAAARAPAEPAKAVAERRPPRTDASSSAAAGPLARPGSVQPAPAAEPAASPTPQAMGATPPAADSTGATSATSASTHPNASSGGSVNNGHGGSSANSGGSSDSGSSVTTATPATEGNAATPPLAAVPAAAMAAPLAATVPAPSPLAAEVLAPLKLVRYIEPEIPVRIRGRLKPSSEVTVAFKVQPDGSVSDVGIRQTTARALDPIVLDAVRQWRYDPVPAEREHVVQLVFNLTE